MSTTAYEIVPEARRDAAAAALVGAFGADDPDRLEPVGGGASGALIYRARVAGRWYLLRMETRADAMRNPHQYVCMTRAAEAGIAPPVRFLDGEGGVVVMDFLTSRPLDEFPGGPPALVRAAGELTARLQSVQGFPTLADYRSLLRRMIGALQGAGLFAGGLLDAHAEGFERIADTYPWDAEDTVASHDDPNVRNLLFDGARLWLVDWETAYRNDPLTDVAILAENLAHADALESVLLTAWRGRAPGPELRARIYLMRVLTRLYYAGLVLTPLAVHPPVTPDRDLSAPTLEQLSASVAGGELAVGAPEFMYVFGKMLLAGFLSGVRSPRLDDALAVLGGT